jgi:hypothetical protein
MAGVETSIFHARVKDAQRTIRRDFHVSCKHNQGENAVS